ncbi:MAG: transketolase [Desulfofustis sp. PB-SRB1]|jgi:transketolase C-terminal domain/subunit/transketolase N-terminal domain/subunit|nr:transketolase [Desulfofustis sp. PB-SRB1]MBM1000793.1 transketolase [Desulfofustis sp. PB-SRB1]HBH27842.1 transketolase [Desulfofustis sp.]HBH30426.1 transketolase [Desulfofustis sp.]
MKFPIDLTGYHPLSFDISKQALTVEEHRVLADNIALTRDSIIFFTALARVKGLGGHTGGAYDIVPELLIVDGFMKGNDHLHPVYFDEAGHRVAIQYLMAALNGHRPIDDLLHYREFGKGLYGHPERDEQGGVFFSSGRLGHLWSYVNGVAEADREKVLFLFGSDGSQQEGGDAEAARYAVARGLNVKLLIDDNDVTIAGHPSRYLPGFSVAKTLAGHGLSVDVGDGEQLDELYGRIQRAITTSGPVAMVNRRKMAPGVPGIEGSPKGHDVIPVEFAIEYLTSRGHDEAVSMLREGSGGTAAIRYRGSSEQRAKCRDDFGKLVCNQLDAMADPAASVLVVDSDLEGSCGLHHIRKRHPDVYVLGGIMERNNFSVAAGFGSEPGRQGVFGTFSAFLEMVVSEISMARLNHATVLAHFSHAGVDDMADNTCHFGINNFFAAGGLADDATTMLYFPADGSQLAAMVPRIFGDPGLRFIFSTRSATPFIENEDGSRFYGEGYEFIPGKDEVIRAGTAGYIVSYGEILYRCLDVVERLREEGIDLGLINKPTLNVVDEEMVAMAGASPFVLVVESQNVNTGLGSRFGSWLLSSGYSPRYDNIGVSREGRGGLSEQIPHQELDPDSITMRVRTLLDG